MGVSFASTVGTVGRRNGLEPALFLKSHSTRSAVRKQAEVCRCRKTDPPHSKGRVILFFRVAVVCGALPEAAAGHPRDSSGMLPWPPASAGPRPHLRTEAIARRTQCRRRCCRGGRGSSQVVCRLQLLDTAAAIASRGAEPGALQGMLPVCWILCRRDNARGREGGSTGAASSA